MKRYKITETRVGYLDMDPGHYEEGISESEMLESEKEAADTNPEYMDAVSGDSNIVFELVT